MHARHTFHVTTQDVINPRPDRRKNGWEAQDVIRAGVAFRVWTDPDTGAKSVDRLGKYGSAGRELRDAMLAASVEREPTVEELLDESSVTAVEVLEYLRELGIIGDIVKLITATEAREQERHPEQYGITHQEA